MCLLRSLRIREKGRPKIFHVQEGFERAHVINSNLFFFFPGLNIPSNYVIFLLCLSVKIKIVGLGGKV